MSKFEKFMMYYVTIVSAVGVSAMVFVILQYLGEVCK